LVAGRAMLGDCRRFLYQIAKEFSSALKERRSESRHDVLTCPSSTRVGYVGDGMFHQHRATLRGAGHAGV